MKEFTFQTFFSLLESFIKSGYNIKTVEDYVTSDSKDKKILILRHDVDRYPLNTLKMAELEKERGIKATYYFRIIPSVFQEKILKKINKMGHEISYHYEDLSICNGDFQKAIKHFEKSLDKVRQFSPSKTICMHGSPVSKWDNKKLWDKYDYYTISIMV